MCTTRFIFFLSDKLRKIDLKYFLVTDIISLNTHSRIRTTYKFKNATKMITHGQSHTQNLLQHSTFSKQKQVPALHLTVTT
jgi:hypothetical protein